MIKVKELRNKANLTQAELANRCRTNVRWIQKVESGEINLNNVATDKALLLVYHLYSAAYPEDKTMQECAICAKTAYIMVRELFKNDEDPQEESPE